MVYFNGCLLSFCQSLRILFPERDYGQSPCHIKTNATV